MNCLNKGLCYTEIRVTSVISRLPDEQQYNKDNRFVWEHLTFIDTQSTTLNRLGYELFEYISCYPDIRVAAMFSQLPDVQHNK